MKVTLQNKSTPHALNMSDKFRQIVIIKLFMEIFMKYGESKRVEF